MNGSSMTAPRGAFAVGTIDGDPRVKVAPRPAPMRERRAPTIEEPPLRLTRRGRTLLRALGVLGVAVVSALLVLAAVALLSGDAQASADVEPAQVRYHVVEPGETLWGLALTMSPDADPRDVVERVLELNGLDTANVQAGTPLLFPAG